MKNLTGILDFGFWITGLRLSKNRGFISILLLLSVPDSTAHAQDGPSIMRKVQSAYAALKTYRQVTSLTETAHPGRSIGTMAELRFRQPNTFFLALTNPQSGTTTITSRGREILSYNSSINAYQKLTVAAGKKAVLPSAVPDPIFFLQRGKTETVLTSLTARGTAVVNGVPCLMVTGSKKVPGVPSGSGRMTFWVDRSSYLLWKVRLELKGVPTAVSARSMKNGKRVSGYVRVPVDLTITLVVQEMKANPALKDSDLSFSIPKGATERNLDKYLKPGK